MTKYEPREHVIDAELASGNLDAWRQVLGFPAPPIRRCLLPVGECAYCDANRDEMMPPHDASSRCESGKHPHCTCDTCF